MESIKSKLKINNVIKSNRFMNKNLFITISKEGGQYKYESLIKYLRHPQICKCRGILIYTRTKRIMQ